MVWPLTACLTLRENRASPYTLVDVGTNEGTFLAFLDTFEPARRRHVFYCNAGVQLYGSMIRRAIELNSHLALERLRALGDETDSAHLRQRMPPSLIVAELALRAGKHAVALQALELGGMDPSRLAAAFGCVSQEVQSLVMAGHMAATIYLKMFPQDVATALQWLSDGRLSYRELAGALNTHVDAAIAHVHNGFVSAPAALEAFAGRRRCRELAESLLAANFLQVEEIPATLRGKPWMNDLLAASHKRGDICLRTWLRLGKPPADTLLEGVLQGDFTAPEALDKFRPAADGMARWVAAGKLRDL